MPATLTKRLRFLPLPLLLLGLAACPSPDATAPPVVEPPPPPLSPLEATLLQVRTQHALPAVAAAVVHRGEIVASAAIGNRRHGGSEGVTVDDLWHIGSITKSMTATLAALMVDAGEVSWTTTIADVLPDLAADGRPAYADVTLKQLLSHRSGMIALTSSSEYTQAFSDSLWNHPGTTTEQRRFLVERLLDREPPLHPGSGYLYSNAGYTTAGLMLETIADERWEDLVRRRLFGPAGFEDAGFGAPGTPGQEDQPWGHYYPSSGGGLFAREPGPRSDNWPTIGPAGTVHLSLHDLARWAAVHVAASRGTSTLLSSAATDALHTPLSENGYALGIFALERGWAGLGATPGTALYHGGSNGAFRAIMWLAPDRDVAFVMTTNLGGTVASTALNDLAGRLITQHAPD